MSIFNKIIDRSLYLKITIVLIVIFVITSYDIIGLIYFNNSINHLVFDLILSLLLSVFLITVTFKVFDHQKSLLNAQVEQLTEAYQYIGQINRKIDSILELDISSLDQSKNYPLQEKASKIFEQLNSLLNSHGGLLYFKKPYDFKINLSNSNDKETSNILETLINKDLKKFKYSQNPDYKQKFIEHGLPEEFFKKYEIVSKPVYMHDQDIGIMLLLFKKGTQITDRDLNIIRVFSFYLALNATFKPDFSIQKPQD